MPEPIITGTAIAAGWKILGSLYDKYQDWSVIKSNSNKAQALKERALTLMNDINTRILSGASGDDPDLAPIIEEFINLVAHDAKPPGYKKTQEWIVRSKKPVVGGAKVVLKKAPAKSAQKKAMAKKAPAKSVQKKAVAKKA